MRQRDLILGLTLSAIIIALLWRFRILQRIAGLTSIQSQTQTTSTSTSTTQVTADYASLAQAILELARGSRVPELYTVSMELTPGTTEILPAESNKRIYIYSYAITTQDDCILQLWSGNRNRLLWQLHLNPAAGRTGANLSASWPTALMVTDLGQNLTANTTAPCELTIAYWRQ